METSKKKVMMATTQAARPKKNRMKPGSRNSSKKRARPKPNHITALFRKLSILQLPYYVLKESLLRRKENRYIPLSLSLNISKLSENTNLRAV